MKSLLPLTLLVLLSVMNGCQPKPVVVDNKIWLHRANSIEEAQRYQYEYGGLEIDVYYVDSLETFLIKHDRDSVLARLDLAPVGWAIPVLSGRPEYKQTIDRLITEAGGNTDPAVWLDEFIAAHG